MALLSALARRLGRSRLGALSRVSSLPFQDEGAVPLLAMRGARTGIESSIDPRVILGGGAFAMAPVSLLVAKLLREYEPWEDQFGRESEFYRQAREKNDDLHERVRRRGRGDEPYVMVQD